MQLDVSLPCFSISIWSDRHEATDRKKRNSKKNILENLTDVTRVINYKTKAIARTLLSVLCVKHSSSTLTQIYKTIYTYKRSHLNHNSERWNCCTWIVTLKATEKFNFRILLGTVRNLEKDKAVLSFSLGCPVVVKLFIQGRDSVNSHVVILKHIPCILSSVLRWSSDNSFIKLILKEEIRQSLQPLTFSLLSPEK